MFRYFLNRYISTKFVLSTIILLIFICILIFLLILTVNRIKHPFWAIQPVFHYYDLQYWVHNKGIISPALPDKNKFVNLSKIQSIVITNKNIQDENHKIEWNRVLKCVRDHYLNEHYGEYMPSMHHIVPYFVGHDLPCFLTIFNEPELVLSNNEIVKSNKAIGVMTSRPLTISLRRSTNKYETVEFPAYYVDFLCVDKMRRKQNVAPQLIQTHEYVQRHQMPDISVSIFKREGTITGIVPITTFNTVCYSLKNLNISDAFLSQNGRISLIPVTISNIRILYDFIQTNKSRWSICILPHLSNLMECIKTNNIIAYMTVVHDEVMSCYFFRTTQTTITTKDNGKTKSGGDLIISCFASIRSVQYCNSDDFYLYFCISLFELLQTNKKEKRKEIGYLSVENISDNKLLIQKMSEISVPIAISPTAYFFYNFAHSSFKSDRVFVLC